MRTVSSRGPTATAAELGAPESDAQLSPADDHALPAFARLRLPCPGTALGWGVPVAVLTMTVLVLWTGVTGDRMNLGGDDSHLYYLDPWRWVRHAPLTVIDTGFNGLNARVFLLPFVTVIGVLSWLPVNVQGLCFGLLLAATWTGAARLFPEVVPGARPWGAPAQVAASVTTLAPVVAATQWTHELYSIYWMAALPWLVVFFLRHQATGAWRWVWLAATTTVILAPALSAVAWSAACGLLAVPLIAIGLAASGTRFDLRRLAGLTAAVVGVNLFWLVPMAASAMGGQVQFADATSGEGKDSAERVVRAVAAVQEPVDTVALRVSSRLLESYGSSERAPNEWSQRLHVLGLVPAGLAAAGALVAAGRLRRTLRLLAVLWVAFFWLATVAVFPNGVDAFVWLTRHAPGWAAFRNFHDKFAIPLALVAGLAAGAGFAALTASWRPRGRVLGAGAVIAAMAVYGLPLLRGDYFRLPYQASSATNRVSSGLPDDYLDLLAAVDDLPPGGVLTVPLRSPAWTMVPTAPGGAYIGLSPITMLTGRSDVNGLAAAPRPSTSALAPTLRSAVERGDVAAVAALVRELGVSHVVVGPPGDRPLAARERLGRTVRADAALWSAYVRSYAPRVVSRHGRFSIHAIAAPWATPAVELTAPLPAGDEPITRAGLGERGADVACGGRLTWDQTGPASYRGTVARSDRACSLILRRAFDPRWRLTVGGRTVRPSRALGFAAQFRVPEGPAAQAFTITHDGQALVPVSLGASGLAAAVLLAVHLLRRQRPPSTVP